MSHRNLRFHKYECIKRRCVEIVCSNHFQIFTTTRQTARSSISRFVWGERFTDGNNPPHIRFYLPLHAPPMAVDYARINQHFVVRSCIYDFRCSKIMSKQVRREHIAVVAVVLDARWRKNTHRFHRFTSPGILARFLHLLGG